MNELIENKLDNINKNIRIFKENDPVIVYEDNSSKKLIFLQKGIKLQNKYGSFAHDQIIGSTPGTKVFLQKT